MRALAANPAGDTAVHIAAAQGYADVVKLLAGRGADLNVRNVKGLTPLGALLGRAGGRPGLAPAQGHQLSEAPRSRGQSTHYQCVPSVKNTPRRSDKEVSNARWNSTPNESL